MHVIDVQVDWSAGWANMPSIQVFLSEPPPGIDEIPHRQKQCVKDYNSLRNIVLYYGEKDGFVSYFCETNNKEGFGGRSFDILMEDGSIKTLVGPWSSRSSVMNEEFNVACVEVTYDYVDNPFRYVKFAGAMTVESVVDALDKYKPFIELCEIEQHGEYTWIPKVKGKPGKWELTHGNTYGDPDYMPDELVAEWNSLTRMERSQRRFIS